MHIIEYSVFIMIFYRLLLSLFLFKIVISNPSPCFSIHSLEQIEHIRTYYAKSLAVGDVNSKCSMLKS